MHLTSRCEWTPIDSVTRRARHAREYSYLRASFRDEVCVDVPGRDTYKALVLEKRISYCMEANGVCSVSSRCMYFKEEENDIICLDQSEFV